MRGFTEEAAKHEKKKLLSFLCSSEWTKRGPN